MYRLLIADDERIEREALYETLKRNVGDQCAIFQAQNGREALKIYEEERIQIAVLDIEMPGLNGIETAEKIREKDKNCCIIFLTAFDEFSYAKKAIGIRVLDYLLKPFDQQELLLVVEEAMRLTGGQSGREDEKGEEPVQVFEEAEDGNDARILKVAKLTEEYIENHYMYDISMQDAARAMNYSEAYFSRLFKQCFQKNFTAYLTEFRVEEAKRRLQEPTVNVKAIGKAVGYGDSNYFAKVFKRITGVSPTEYRLSVFQEKPDGTC